jgi:hypothetical protein
MTEWSVVGCCQTKALRDNARKVKNKMETAQGCCHKMGGVKSSYWYYEKIRP